MDWVTELEIGCVTLSHAALPVVTLSKYCPPPQVSAPANFVQ